MNGERGNVLLTGGAGYIGSHCCVELLQAGWQVTVLDNFSNARRDVITRIGQTAGTAPPKLVEGDIRDAALLQRLFVGTHFDAVLHFAALKSVEGSVREPLRYWDVNVVGTLRLVQAMVQAGCGRLVFSSSATVYSADAAARGALREDTALDPVTPYGHTKLACERLIAAEEAATPGFAASILRYFNPAGAHPSALIGEEPADPPDNLIPYIAQVADGRRSVLRVFGDDWPTPDGTGVRDYVHVCDLARGHVAALEVLARDGRGHVVNLGTGKGHSVLEMRAAYARATGRDIPIKIVDRRLGDLASCHCDTTKARSLLSFEARHGAEDICASSWAWTRRSRTR